MIQAYFTTSYDGTYLANVGVKVVYRVPVELVAPSVDW